MKMGGFLRKEKDRSAPLMSRSKVKFPMLWT
jgi:hypothetical protein